MNMSFMDLKLFFIKLWRIWKKIWLFISYCITIFCLIILFYTVITLYGLIARLLKIDLLDLIMKKNVKSYWNEKEKIEEYYYKQF